MKTYKETELDFIVEFDGSKQTGIKKGKTETRIVDEAEEEYNPWQDLIDSGATIEWIDRDALQAEQDVIEAKALAKQQKLEGIEIFDVMCSATAEDQHGLTDIKPMVLLGYDINFHFENKSKLLLTKDNIAEFESIWFPFRMSFFQ